MHFLTKMFGIKQPETASTPNKVVEVSLNQPNLLKMIADSINAARTDPDNGSDTQVSAFYTKYLPNQLNLTNQAGTQPVAMLRGVSVTDFKPNKILTTGNDGGQTFGLIDPPADNTSEIETLKNLVNTLSARLTKLELNPPKAELPKYVWKLNLTDYTFADGSRITMLSFPWFKLTNSTPYQGLYYSYGAADSNTRLIVPNSSYIVDTGDNKIGTFLSWGNNFVMIKSGKIFVRELAND